MPTIKSAKKAMTPIFAPLNRVAGEIGGALCLVNDRRRLLPVSERRHFWHIGQ
jgi:hypothetical protein